MGSSGHRGSHKNRWSGGVFFQRFVVGIAVKENNADSQAVPRCRISVIQLLALVINLPYQ